LGAAVDVEFAVDVANVVLGRAEGDDQGFGDLAVRKASRDQAQDLQFAVTERLDEIPEFGRFRSWLFHRQPQIGEDAGQATKPPEQPFP
jgi:hypothetical protein